MRSEFTLITVFISITSITIFNVMYWCLVLHPLLLNLMIILFIIFDVNRFFVHQILFFPLFLLKLFVFPAVPRTPSWTVVVSLESPVPQPGRSQLLTVRSDDHHIWVLFWRYFGISIFLSPSFLYRLVDESLRNFLFSAS